MTMPPTAAAADLAQSGKQAAGEATQSVVPAGQTETLDFLAPPQSPTNSAGWANIASSRCSATAAWASSSWREDTPSCDRKVAIKADAAAPRRTADIVANASCAKPARPPRIEHDHIVPIFQVGEDNGVPYIVMPFLKGEPLDERLKRDGKTAAGRSRCASAAEMAEGLAAAHATGLVHRDIKPANVWLERRRP